MTEKEMIYILENKLVNTLSASDKKKIYNFAFGKEFMKSKDKGEIKTYKEKIGVNKND